MELNYLKLNDKVCLEFINFLFYIIVHSLITVEENK